MAVKSMNDLLIDELRDIYHAEKQLTRALPKMARAASNEQLKQAFTQHLEETQGQIDRLEQVFEPHFRLSGQQQGYGLGLGIARNIAHSHGGEVSLQNLREGGLRVTLQLPRNAD